MKKIIAKSIFLDNIRANPTNVQEVLDEVMNIAKNNNYNIAYAWCLIYKGWDYHIRCEYDKACHCRIEASEIFIKNNGFNGSPCGNGKKYKNCCLKS